MKSSISTVDVTVEKGKPLHINKAGDFFYIQGMNYTGLLYSQYPVFEVIPDNGDVVVANLFYKFKFKDSFNSLRVINLKDEDLVLRLCIGYGDIDTKDVQVSREFTNAMGEVHPVTALSRASGYHGEDSLYKTYHNRGYVYRQEHLIDATIPAMEHGAMLDSGVIVCDPNVVCRLFTTNDSRDPRPFGTSYTHNGSTIMYFYNGTGRKSTQVLNRPFMLQRYTNLWFFSESVNGKNDKTRRYVEGHFSWHYNNSYIGQAMIGYTA